MAKKSASESILQEKTVRTSKAFVDSDSRFKVLKRVSIISVVVVVAICLIMNILIHLILDDKLTFDSSSVHSNSISSISENYLDQLNKKVEIIGLFDKNDDTLWWPEYFVSILEDYEAKADGKIDVSYIDPAVNPYIYTELDPDNVYGLSTLVSYYGGVYVVKCEDNLTFVNPYNCFVPDTEIYNTYGYFIPTTNDVELNITGSILYVTSDNPLHAYYLTGHQESQSHSSVDKLLKSIGFETATLDLSHQNAKIPVDCNLILILQPLQDISESERDLLKLYMKNGGNLLVVNAFIKERSVVFNNLNEVTRSFGINMDNAVLHENNANYLVETTDAYTSYVRVNPNLQDLNTSASYRASNIRYISAYTDKSDSVSVTPILITSEDTSVEFENTSIGTDVTIGSYPAVLQGSDSYNTSAGELFVFATTDFTSDEYYAEKTLQDMNADFFRTMVQIMCPTNIGVGIPEKTIPNYSLQKPLSSNEITMWSMIVMTVIPLGCLIIGGVVYKKRRHL